MRARSLLASLAVGAATLVAPASALAGTYHVTANLNSDIDGWVFSSGDGFFGCSPVNRPGPCSDGDVPRPSPLRIFALGAAKATEHGLWQWETPPGVTLVSGSLTVDYDVGPYTTAYVKTRMRNETWNPQPELHPVNDRSGHAIWSLTGGREAFGLFLRTESSRTYTDKWNNTVRATAMELTLRDDHAPLGSLSGPLADGTWHNESQPVCVSVTATDAGGGVASASLLDDHGAVLDTAQAPLGSALHPGAASFKRDLCTAPAALGDGTHQLSVRVSDVAGETTTLPLDVAVDAQPPAASGLQPAGSTTQLRPVISFGVDPGPSGLATFSAIVDGAPMTIAGNTATFTPAADLAYGVHTVSWSAADRAGNSRDGTWTFAVVDLDAPVLSNAEPAAGWSGELRRPMLSFDLTDAGVGVDEASLHVLLDGGDVAPLGVFTNGHFQFTPGFDLTYGAHQVRVLAADRSHNAMPPAAWSFTVTDVTPPLLGDVRPDDGSSGSDRTPVISAALGDAGVGIDPASVILTVDGVDVSAHAQLTGGRLTYLPAMPLAFGEHVAVLRAADRSGNAAAPLSWRFTVRDEAPPVIGARTPAPGTTVTGASAIELDVTDVGVGVDPASLVVTLDSSDVTSWGTFSAGHFQYAPGDMAAGVHTVTATVADRAGNVTGPVVWQFAVAAPDSIGLNFASGAASITFGGHATLSVRATSNGVPLAAARVLVSARPAGSAVYGPPRALVTGTAGMVSWSVAPAHTTTYRIELADDAASAISHTVVVRQRVTLNAGTRTLRRGMPLRLSGRVYPAHPGAVVSVQMLTGRGWLTVARPRLGSGSGFTTTVVPRSPGRYLLRVSVPGGSTNGPGLSRTVSVTVR